MTTAGIIAALLVVLPGVWGEAVPAWFAHAGGDGDQSIPVVVSLLGLMPSVGVLAGLVLCAATSREVARQAHPRSP
jgi:hypothetical protein